MHRVYEEKNAHFYCRNSAEENMILFIRPKEKSQMNLKNAVFAV